ncbi:juvenile hormone epoxide hydrolase-like isoform X1 [Bolinopsis microptera]|uniref:juvenile hormone epoxide hydrolase-like isoform X1 n=1 Tax=Bolinopsis microptera TaxID=2820187 RepID=UPI00307AA85C
MLQLGYKRFVIHGGDWGAIIGSLMTYMYPESVIGLHTTMNQMKFGWRLILQTMVGAVFPSLVYTTEKEKGVMHPLSTFGQRMYYDMAYFHVQSVLPDSYGYGMVDSPVGLIGSTYAMVSSSRDTTKNAMENMEAGIKCFGIDNICAMISIIWSVKSAQASMRIYHEFYTNDTELFSNLFIPNVPVAISNFPNEVMHLTKFATRATFNNIKQYNYHNHGGHFSNIDNTEAVVGDLTSFIQTIQ